MMSHFDRTKTLSQLHDFVLRRAYEQDFERAASNNALWNISSGMTKNAVKCILVDLQEDARKLLSKAKQWMLGAIETQEKTKGFEETSNKFHRQLFSTIQWLHDGVHDQENLRIWRDEALQTFRNHPDWIPTANLSLEAVTFINAGAHEEFIALAAPAGIDSIKCSGANEKQMALTLAAKALTQKFPEEKVKGTVQKFLDNNVGKWLNDGHAVRAAEWMKVIYWKRGEAGISPFDAVRKCLDHVEH